MSICTSEQQEVMPITLTQQTALITVASRGIGRGVALKCAEQGMQKIADPTGVVFRLLCHSAL
jgi:hypothetical protein